MSSLVQAISCFSALCSNNATDIHTYSSALRYAVRGAKHTRGHEAHLLFTRRITPKNRHYCCCAHGFHAQSTLACCGGGVLAAANSEYYLLRASGVNARPSQLQYRHVLFLNTYTTEVHWKSRHFAEPVKSRQSCQHQSHVYTEAVSACSLQSRTAVAYFSRGGLDYRLYAL